MATDQQKPLFENPNALAVKWIPLAELSQSGAYVAKETGDLIRVPPDGESTGEEELFGKGATQQLLVAKVSDNPFIPITKARLAAAALDIEISF